MLKKISLELLRCIGWLFWNPIQVLISNHTNFFNYKRLLRLRFFGNPVMLQENSWYGHLRAIRAMGGFGFGARIEHAAFFRENTTTDIEGAFTPLSMRVFHLKRVYTFSEGRRRFVLRFLESRGLSVEVVAIGPYILYVRNFLSKKELVAIKRRLGRVLLVYPQHSTETIMHNYDTGIVLERIARMRHGYNTVLVSLYWLDIVRGMASAYESAGYTIVCAGRREDPNSLSRQKDILTLADRILSNAVGTYVGYAVSMGKPCTLFKQKIETVATTEEDVRNLNGSKDNIEKLYPVFSAEEGEVTEEQRNLVKEFWGEAKK